MIYNLMIASLISSTAIFRFAQSVSNEDSPLDDQQRLCSPEINFLTHVQLAGNGNPRCHQPDDIDVSDPKCLSKVYTFESTKVDITIDISTPTDSPACELRPLAGIKYAIAGNHFQKEVVKCGELAGGDLVLIVDESGSIQLDNYNNFIKPLLKEIVKAVSPTNGESPSPVNVATVTFGSSARIQFGLKTRTSNQVQKLIDDLLYAGTSTAIGDALSLAATGVLIPPFDTDSNPNICIVLTDGPNNAGIDLQDGAIALQTKCKTIFAVGIGNNVDDNTLTTIASDPEKVIRVGDFAELSESLVAEITQQMCAPTGETKTVCNASNCKGIFKQASHAEFQELKNIYERCNT